MVVILVFPRCSPCPIGAPGRAPLELGVGKKNLEKVRMSKSATRGRISTDEFGVTPDQFAGRGFTGTPIFIVFPSGRDPARPL